uniref:uncharacterized protein LOC122590556 n=1 Tax=Erigeron canadensis TaxID=72917 RepID=UPI001CB90439|nr:uncharacterized protein LOC122590556 [Erigeron canadensis]
MDLILSQNEELSKLPKAAGNNQYLAPRIQKDITTCFEVEVLKSIFKYIGDDAFELLVDESSDVLKKEQMAIVLRYVDTHGLVKERFVSLVHVMETSSSYIKVSIDEFFAKHKLSLMQLRGQGYDCARSGLNQELSLTRPGDTTWNSHYRTLLRLEVLFPSVLSVLDYVKKEGTNGSTQNKAIGLKRYLSSFDCVFLLHLMSHILGITDVLSLALQRKDQDILEAVSTVNSTKRKLQEYRLNGFERLLKKVSLFCVKHGIKLLKMDEICANKRCQWDNITNRHYYEFDSFNTILDLIIIEFGNHFSEASTELLNNMAALNPCASFSNFDVSKLVRLSEMYPYDFDDNKRKTLLHELELYHDNVQHDVRFVNLNSITSLAMLMVETRKHLSYPLVNRLLKLALVLPVATATVERCFSSMKLVKADLRNRIGDMFFNLCLICSVEREALANVTNEQIIERFLKMGTRKGQL